MASGVSVESAAIQGGIGCCKTSIHELESASRSLQRSYQQAGSGGWKDQKYAALGGIVEECCSALDVYKRQGLRCLYLFPLFCVLIFHEGRFIIWLILKQEMQSKVR